METDLKRTGFRDGLFKDKVILISGGGTGLGDGGQQNWGDPWFGGRPRYFELDYEVARRAE